MAVLSKDTIDTIIKAVKTARIFDVESFIIEPDRIRGMSESRSAFLYNGGLNIDIECAIGINRSDILVNRLTLFDGREDRTIECKIDDRTGEAHSLIIKSNKVKAEYKCAKVKAIRAPKSIYVEKEYHLEIGEDAVNMIVKADAAMKAETLVIRCNDDVITYEFKDSNNDVFQYEAGNRMVNLINDQPANLSYCYPVKVILLALKHNICGNFFITEKGMLATEVNGMTIYIPSKKE